MPLDAGVTTLGMVIDIYCIAHQPKHRRLRYLNSMLRKSGPLLVGHRVFPQLSHEAMHEVGGLTMRQGIVSLPKFLLVEALSKHVNSFTSELYTIFPTPGCVACVNGILSTFIAGLI